ncbi:hypothetical protein ACGF3C_02285 [Micromonospora sp. NPDC047762]|uniref:hypothetical protein n=1 Tax=Micromonospora sp. NPDC047762 TaxID=3364255 RepID=UPI0037150B37
MKVTVTSSGLNELAVALESAADDAVDEGRKVVARGAFQIKADWRRRWSGSPHAPALPYAIGYDVRTRGTTVSAEVGPDKAKRQGALGNLYEFGSVNNAPRPGGAPALAAEEPRYVAALENLAADLLED